MFIEMFSSFIVLLLSGSASCSLADRDPRISEKIVGGEQSPIHYSYQLSLQVNTTNTGIFTKNFSHICGASIISENFMLTAAHCVVNQVISKLSVLAGTSNLKDESKGSRHPILSILVHPDYKELNTSDIALCKVKIPFVYGPNVAKIDLGEKYVDGDVNCTLTGWGSVRMMRYVPIPFYSFFAYPNELQRAYLLTLTNENCFKKGFVVDNTQICTFTKFRQGACAGDSGGPLADGNILVGIVSYGTAICSLGRPDVFTRVSTFVDWIKSSMNISSITLEVHANADTTIPEAFQ